MLIVGCGDVGRRVALAALQRGESVSAVVRSEQSAAALRAEWGDGSKLVGTVGRLDPMKDHLTFLAAAQVLCEKRPDVRFVCVGDGPPAYRDSLRRRALELGVDPEAVEAVFTRSG